MAVVYAVMFAPLTYKTGVFVVVTALGLAEFSSSDTHWMRRLRTLTIGFLTPFYFLPAGTLVLLPALVTAPIAFLVLLGGKVLSKIFGLYPVIRMFRRRRDERWYYTLMMSTGLTFGTISALYGFSHGIATREQYSFLVAVVIASAVVPTLIAGAAFLPRHLLPERGKPARNRDASFEEEGWRRYAPSSFSRSSSPSSSSLSSLL
jgi:glutathione-regulated potassium-efflux system ancillary protein KefC